MAPRRAHIGLMAWLATFSWSVSAGLHIPSSAWISESAPYNPRTPEDCLESQVRFEEIIQQLEDQHEECLRDAQGEVDRGETCSHESCQWLHTDRDKARKKAAEANADCRRRLQAYERQQQEEAQRQRRRDELLHQPVEEVDVTQALDSPAPDPDPNFEPGSNILDAANFFSYGQLFELGPGKTQDDAGSRSSLANVSMEEKGHIELGAVHSSQPVAVQTWLQSVWASFSGWVDGARRFVGKIWSFMGNPFTSLFRLEGAELQVNSVPLATAVDKVVVDEAIQAVMGDIKEGVNPFYEQIVKVTDKARSRGLAGNPVAKQSSDVAMSGVHTIHKKVLGALEQVQADVKDFNVGLVADERGSRPIPEFKFAAGTNPFRPRSSGLEPAIHAGGAERPPAGFVLYRDPISRMVKTIKVNDPIVSEHKGDRPELGLNGCSESGFGIVTLECEMKRQKGVDKDSVNPFSARW